MSQQRSADNVKPKQAQSPSSSPCITHQPASSDLNKNIKCEKGSECAETTNGEKVGSYIFHRNRELPTPDPNDPPIKQIKFYLDRYKIKEALQIFFHDSTLRLLNEEPNFMWDVIPLICRRLRGLCQYRFRVFEGCERMLCRIAVDENCNPKEVLISLLAEINQSDHDDDDNVFRAMIRPLEGTLLRMNMPSPREENFRWTLSVLMRHINDIELPQEYDIEGKKRQSLPNDPSVKRFIEVLPLIMSFIEKFNDKPADYDGSPMPILTESQIDEVLNGELVDDDFMNDDHTSIRCDITDASITALLQLINKPFTYLDTSHCKELGITVNRCLNIILKLLPNLFAPIYTHTIIGPLSDSLGETMSEIVSSNISPLATSHFNGSDEETLLTLATCAYLLRCETNSSSSLERAHSFPHVLNHEALLYCHIPYVVALLKKSEILVHEKGLCLLDNLLSLMDYDSLDHRFLSIYKCSTLMRQLFQIMVFSPYCKNRRRAYVIFTRICDLLTYDCKAEMFKWVLSQTDLRPCIRAACIDQYRKHLTIINQELMKHHQQLSVVTTFSPQSPKDDQNMPILNVTTNDRLSDSRQGISDNLPDDHTNLLNRLTGDYKKTSLNGRDVVQLDSASNIWILSSNIMRQINLWQTRYKILGGQEMVNFLNLCIEACLPETQHTDIIDNYELVLATLTMLRYLRLRKTLVKDDVELDYLCAKKLKKLLFDPVRSAIALVMNELKLHHKELVEAHKANSRKKSKPTGNSLESPESVMQIKNTNDVVSKLVSSESELKVGEKMQQGDISKENEDLVLEDTNDEPDGVECLNWTLCRLDLVESVLVRTCDLYNC